MNIVLIGTDSKKLTITVPDPVIIVATNYSIDATNEVKWNFLWKVKLLVKRLINVLNIINV